MTFLYTFFFSLEGVFLTKFESGVEATFLSLNDLNIHKAFD